MGNDKMLEILLDVGSEVRRRRRLLQMSQGTLSKKADIPRSYLSLMETEGVNLSIISLHKLSKALDCRVVDLLCNH